MAINRGVTLFFPDSLQLLVENALKHNVLSTETPLRTSIRYKDGYPVVANNLQKKTQFEPSPQTGLSNLSERIKLITGKELIISEDANEFCVKLPLV